MVQVVNRYIDQGVAELVPGVLFVDEVNRILSYCVCLAFLSIQTVALGSALQRITKVS
jgi:DNA helicase TIP49 (TBP-interacting protein)